MNESIDKMETVQQKLSNLDNEVNTFLQVIKEVKEMKDAAGVIHERLLNHEGDIEIQKKELEKLTASTNNLIINIEEKTKEVILVLENKVDSLLVEVKSGLSQISTVFENGNAQLQTQQINYADNISNKYEELKNICELLKAMVESHEQKMNDLRNGYSTASGVFNKMDSSLNEMKKTVYELQMRPYEIDNKIKKMEERLELSINEKYSKQKNVTVVLLLMLIAIIFFSVIGLYLR
ncbi:MAG: hypothetical protein HY757_09705 [Nitrospirae bacterium]|nr:hypothetical protein [Nitrospirota bacterium]